MNSNEATNLNPSNSKFRTILRRFSDRPDCQKLLNPIGVKLSGASFFEFGIAGYHRKAGQKGTQFLFVSSNLSRFKRIPHSEFGIAAKWTVGDKSSGLTC